jgi:hypothetical protein
MHRRRRQIEAHELEYRQEALDQGEYDIEFDDEDEFRQRAGNN